MQDNISVLLTKLINIRCKHYLPSLYHQTFQKLESPLPALRLNADQGLLIIEVSRSHTTTHHSRQDSSGPVISPLQRPLPDNTKHSWQTSINRAGFEPTNPASDRPQTHALGIEVTRHLVWANIWREEISEFGNKVIYIMCVLLFLSSSSSSLLLLFLNIENYSVACEMSEENF